MKTRKACIALLLFISSSLTYAQQDLPKHIHQAGINFNSLNSFGLHYKTGNEKTLLRLSLLSLNAGITDEWGRTEDSLDVNQQSYGAGFRLGFEKHVPVAAHFNFICGLEAGCNINFQKQKYESLYMNYDRSEWSVSPLIDLVLGVTYTVAEHFVIGAEITPAIQYTFGKSKNTGGTQSVEQTHSDFRFAFSTTSASLSLAYRFGK